MGSMEDLVVRNFLAPIGANWRQIGANWRQITPMNMRFFMFFQKIGANWRQKLAVAHNRQIGTILALFWRQIGGELAPNGANWRQLAIANFVQPPNFGGDWRYRQLAFDTYDEKGDSYRQLAPIGANRNLWRQNFWRQYVWRQCTWRQCIWRQCFWRQCIWRQIGANVFGFQVMIKK